MKPTIDDEFKNYLVPLRYDELKDLQESIKKHGCLDSLKTWKGVLIDGHNRFAICEKENIPYDTEEISGLSDRNEVKLFIIKNQKGRRNLNDYQRVYLAEKESLVISDILHKKQIANIGGDRRSESYRNPGQTVLTEPVSQKSDELVDDKETDLMKDNPFIKIKERKEASKEPVRRIDIVAEVAGVSHDTVHKVRKIEKEATPKQKEALNNNEMSINKVFNSLPSEIEKQKKKEEEERLKAEKEEAEKLKEEERLKEEKEELERLREAERIRKEEEEFLPKSGLPAYCHNCQCQFIYNDSMENKCPKCSSSNVTYDDFTTECLFTPDEIVTYSCKCSKCGCEKTIKFNVDKKTFSEVE